MTNSSPSFAIECVSVDAHGGPLAPLQEATTQLLRDERVLSAVQHADADDVSLGVLLAVTEDRQVLALDERGMLRFDLTADQLRERFAAAGLKLWLDSPESCDVCDERDDESLVDDVDDVDDVDEADDVDPDESFDFDDDAFDADFALQPVQVSEFSHRGPASARITAQMVKAEVAYVALGEWSLFRYETTEDSTTIALGSADYPVVTLNRPAEGEAWLEIAGPQHQHIIRWPNGERLTAPVLPVESVTDPDANAAYRALLRDDVWQAEELQGLPAGSVDVDAALAACIPEAAGGVQGHDERLRAFIAAFGVPGELIDQALGDEPAGVRFAARGWGSLTKETLIGGIGDTIALTRRERPLARISRLLRRRPWLGFAISVAEFGVGALLISIVWPIARILGIFVVIDAVIDLVLWGARMRRRAASRR